MSSLRFPALALLVLLAVGCASSGSSVRSESGEPVVAVIGGQPLDLPEFERQYLRTTLDTLAAANDSLGAYQDFLERYVDFRLKVLQAQRAGYADRADLATEMESYRKQLARPYLMDKEVVKPLIEELYARKQEMVDVSHILIRVDPAASPADTLRAFNLLSGILDSLSTGASFEQLAFDNSQDPSAQADRDAVGYRGRLGFFSGGRMVKPFEDQMFATPVGAVSPVFRTQFGYHALKVNDRQPARPDVRISHIMVQPRGQNPADSADALARVDAVLGRLAAGEPFAAVASDLSEDRASGQKGGDLDFVSFDGWLPLQMRDAVFADDSLNTVIGPIQTRFGYHIVTRTAIRERPGLEESFDALKGEVARLPRSEQAEKAYARSLRDQFGTTVDSARVATILASSSPDSLISRALEGSLPEDLAAAPIATLADSVFSVQQFMVFAAGLRGQRAPSAAKRMENAMEGFLDEKAIEYEMTLLGERDETFRRTLREFEEGLMLFRLMEDSVWTAAANDTTALEQYFADRAADYQYPDRTRILSITTRSDSVMTLIESRLRGGLPYRALVDAYRSDSTSTVRFDTTYVEGPTESVYDRALELGEGGISEVQSYAGGKILLINDGMDPARPKTFEEARAEVITQYQAIVEERMVARLRKEYNVVTYPERLPGAFAGYRSAQP